jgi:methylated-DNA-[protein]-cysteine S-methyltransferase
MPSTTYDSPIGPLALTGDARGTLTAIGFGPAGPDHDDAGALGPAVAALDAYFAGDGAALAGLDVELIGTPFQRAVWGRLRAIPAGDTISYTGLARELGRPDAVRAVAAAVGRTPVPVVVPCHRVVGSDGSLTGYRGGLERKAALLDLEKRSRRGDSNP